MAAIYNSSGDFYYPNINSFIIAVGIALDLALVQDPESERNICHWLHQAIDVHSVAKITPNVTKE